MFSQYNVEFTKQDYAVYQAINQPLWVAYQDGKIDAAQLQHRRFEDWASTLQCTTQDLNKAFIASMAILCEPLIGAASLLSRLKNQAKLGIITNGFSDLQATRLERTGFKSYFDLLVVSEDVGVAKPHPHIFEHALKMAGNPAREKVLMVGDNPVADIYGGMNAGFDTCWLNINQLALPNGIKPNYEVASLVELENILIGHTALV